MIYLTTLFKQVYLSSIWVFKKYNMLNVEWYNFFVGHQVVMQFCCISQEALGIIMLALFATENIHYFQYPEPLFLHCKLIIYFALPRVPRKSGRYRWLCTLNPDLNPQIVPVTKIKFLLLYTTRVTRCERVKGRGRFNIHMRFRALNLLPVCDNYYMGPWSNDH